MPAMDQLLRDSVCLFLLLEFLSSLGHPIHTPSHERFKRQAKAPPTKLTVSSFLVRSVIVSRYASTRVRTVMSNPHTEAKEAVFDLDLPSAAFISNFTITINEKIYVAEVKEKHQAKKMYDEARRQGKTAAHVGTKDRETEKFRVSTNVEAGGQAAFELTYEELLQRHLGRYQHAISIRPQQVVRNLSVEVSISERTGIDYVHVLPLRTSRLLTNTVRGDSEVPPSTRVEKGTHCAWIVFTPTPQEQAMYSSSGIVADFVVQYDVAMPDVAGDVQIYDGYFVHYFAPRGLPPVQKDVVFVIDTSGSMYGTKMKQTKKAMDVILSDLHSDDYFNIITFSDTVHVWKPSRPIQATPQNIRRAKDYIGKMEADGWTDINAALLAAASVFSQSSPTAGKGTKEPRIPLIIFLTDGEPTSGVTAGSRILSNAHQAFKGTVSLFGLAFGDDADYGLLRRLSLENRGVARRIYEDADAALQLKGFYDEIASPLLYDVQLAYLDGTAQDLTRNLFPNYFQGSELIVAGRVKPGASELRVRTMGHGQEGPLDLENDISANTTEAAPFGCTGEVGQIGRFVQRLWAYFTIQDLLQARFRTNDTAARRLLTEKATNLSLKYNFVTPVTSLIVVRPEEPEGVTPGHGVTNNPMVMKALKGTVGPRALPTTSVPVTATGVIKTVRPASLPVTAVPTITATGHASPLATTSYTKATKVPPGSGVAAMPVSPAVIHGSTKPPRATTSIRATRPPTKIPKPSPTRARRLKITAQPHSVQETKGTAITKVLGGVTGTVLGTPATTHPPGNTKGLGNNSSGWEPASEHRPHMPSQAGTPRMETEKFPGSQSTPKGGTAMELGTEKPPLNSTVPWVTAPGATTRLPQGTEPTGRIPSTSPSSISLLLLPGESELLSITDVAGEYVESLNPPAVYSFVTAKQQPGRCLERGPALQFFGGPAQSAPPPLRPRAYCFGRGAFTSNPSSQSLVSHELGEQQDGRIGILLDEELRLVGLRLTDGLDNCVTLPEGGSSIKDSTDYEDYLDSDETMGSSNSGFFTFSSWVDGDPHFVVRLPHSLGNLCFTLDGGPGDILNLVSDLPTGLVVNGHLMGAPLRPGHKERPRTYLDAISVMVNHPRATYVVNVTRKSVALHGEDTLVLPFAQRAVVRMPQLAISVWPETNVTIWIKPGVEFLVLLHHYIHPTALQRDHLGFYVVDGTGLSDSAHGLLGQFQNGDFRLSPDPVEREQEAWLWRGPQKVPVAKVTQVLKESSRRAHEAPCWLVKQKDVEGLLGAPYSSYVAGRRPEM